jgi:hypothetical protein
VRRLAISGFVLVALSGCSVPTAQSLNCGEDQSIFACQAKFSDGKSRNIVFVKRPTPGQTVLDEVTTRDDLGNLYCVTLYDNVTATYLPGECGATVEISPALEPTSTSVDPGAQPLGVACTEGTPVLECRAAYSDGTNRKVEFVTIVPDEYVRLDSDPHIDEAGKGHCVSIWGLAEDSLATVRDGTNDC